MINRDKNQLYYKNSDKGVTRYLLMCINLYREIDIPGKRQQTL